MRLSRNSSVLPAINRLAICCHITETIILSRSISVTTRFPCPFPSKIITLVGFDIDFIGSKSITYANHTVTSGTRLYLKRSRNYFPNIHLVVEPSSLLVFDLDLLVKLGCGLSYTNRIFPLPLSFPQSHPVHCCLNLGPIVVL